MRVNTDGVLLGAWVGLSDAGRILDIGTGTGVIALMAAQRSPQAQVVGVEIDANSFADADANASSSDYKDRVIMIHSSLQDFSSSYAGKFDHIVSNPPYFVSGTVSEQAGRAAVRHTVHLSFEDLVSCALKLMSENGKFSLILPTVEGGQFSDLAVKSGFSLERLCHVYINPTTIGRVLMTFSFKSTAEPLIAEQIVIRQADGSYSKEYVQLTKDFYLNF